MKKQLIFLFWCILILCVILGSSIVLAKTTISFWGGFPEMMPVYKKAAMDYQKIHPDVEVELLSFSIRDLETKIAASIPTDTGPDIIESYVDYMIRFIEAGFIPPNPPDIDAMFKGGSYSEFVVNHLTYGENTFGIPLFRGRGVLYWNKEMFAEEGLTHAPRNWDEVIDYAKKLARYDAQGNLTRSGISLRLSGGGMGIAQKWWWWLYPAGGTILEKYPDGKYRAGYDNEAGQEALKFYIDIVHKYHVDDQNIKHDADAFALELTAMFNRESWVVGHMQQYAPHVEFDTADCPSYKRSGTIEVLFNTYVTRSCKNSEVAWDFIKFMLQPEYQKYLFETAGWIPARDDIDYSDIYEKIPQYKTFLEVPENFKFYTNDPIGCIDEIMTRLSAKLEDAFFDKSLVDNPEGIARVISEAAQETNDILKENELYHEE